MSEQTKAHLEAAIAAHIADECDGGMVTGYLTITQYTGIDLMQEKKTGYLRIQGDSQNFTTSLGLAHYLSRRMDESIFEDDD